MYLPKVNYPLFIVLSCFVIDTIFVFLNFAQDTNALTMTNGNYIIQMGNLNSFAGNKSNGQYKLSDTGGQIGAGLYTGPNYKIRSGFQYIHSIIPFRFSISGGAASLVDFGTLDPTSPVLRYQSLTIDNNSANGYVVTVSENRSLLSVANGKSIIDTSCDGGNCTLTTAGAWTSTLTYGFGYRCDQLGGTNYCISDFSNATYYKPFANLSQSSIAPQTVMQGSQAGRSQQTTITYKLNISATQEAGFYTNVVQYIATPTY